MRRVFGTSTKRHVACALSFALPLLCYVFLASAYDYWLDSGEFVAVSVGLGIAHPPGHPLAALVIGALRLLPVGSLSLRVAWACGLCAAASSLALFLAFERQLHWTGLRLEGPRAGLALAASLWCAGTYPWLVQATHPEVYALQAALSCWMLERTLRIESHSGRDAAALYQVAFLGGLALANHHFLALLLIPAVAPTVWQALRQLGVRGMTWSATALMLGLSVYVYLPLRASAGAALRLGQPNTWANFLWLISARAFQKNTGDGVPQPLGERLADVLVALVEGVHWSVVALSILGLYALWRLPITRRIAYLYTAMLVVFITARGWLGFVRSNPDALGYLMMAHVAVVAGALGFIAMLWRLTDERGWAVAPRWSNLLTTLLIAAAIYHGYVGATRTALRYPFNATDVLADPRRRDLPPKAIVLAHAPATIFQYWGGEATENLRPDIVVVPVPFLSYPSMLSQLIHATPELYQLLNGYRRTGRFQASDLESLAAYRPVLLEMDTRIMPELTRTLAPWGLLYQVLPGGATTTDVRIAQRAQETLYHRLYDALGTTQLTYHETSQQLLWLHFMDALYYASYGASDASLIAIDHGLRLQPLAKELHLLKATLLRQVGDGSVDVTPFMPTP